MHSVCYNKTWVRDSFPFILVLRQVLRLEVEFSIHGKSSKRNIVYPQVKRFSYTTSTENSTTGLKMWALERNCTKHCEPGCIVIGERTKLYSCTSCCTDPLCNYGSGAQQIVYNTASLASAVIVALTYKLWLA